MGKEMMKNMAGFDVSRKGLILSICLTHYPALLTPYLDLENKQRALLAKWNIGRGLLNTEWEIPKQ